MNTATFMQQFGPIIIIFAIFYFLIIRPQQKREKERRDMLSSLKEGDDVITVGGIYGKILNIKDDVITLDVGDKIKIKVTRTAIGNILKKREKTED
ncbi:Preprotein translocase, YajC subunit [Tepidanaerobacter acetatoxydans Re1]|uniref:Preprotein translocase, YajC subunit n=1 Tax=Tepidanaerobacter acetatoxydans (strain DSM 21804 / JCM 16047 / Re1) TaxID=1209989 RepID=F4LTJ5_TEPAE|nr:preprotein translocase subunit YajC [Tepidanaerobacter acetatoxydans]AEE91325.1 preprotein translocase, YajC subunit [Tepidanaerobacter acetatoxydans Re1]CCP26013.1 Preprotein translocase, YajC subunit [Tepidanaerobacter acetatoxydans Re1]